MAENCFELPCFWVFSRSVSGTHQKIEKQENVMKIVQMFLNTWIKLYFDGILTAHSKFKIVNIVSSDKTRTVMLCLSCLKVNKKAIDEKLSSLDFHSKLLFDLRNFINYDNLLMRLCKWIFLNWIFFITAYFFSKKIKHFKFLQQKFIHCENTFKTYYWFIRV